MATAIRLDRLAVSAIGEFGRDVARELCDLGARIVPVEDPPDHASALVLVSWRPEPGHCAEWNRRAAAAGTPWLPVMVEHPRLIVGPWIDPTNGPCYSCFEFRRDQHDPGRQLRLRLRRAYSADDTLGVYGHLPHHVSLAESLIRMACAAPMPGSTHLLDLMSSQLSTYQVSARQDCPDCPKSSAWGDPRLAEAIAAAAPIETPVKEPQ
ncbi:TOMM precursor leader peptide-binding protein [Natronoglycomyces albus]|uniref:TOMM leader peptide-binding protein n=1 Tax=Natronoglycomyces albus TaxID=2811108 RepID=A0A895XE38_9ACTN|nr:TOMM precursor leader peptide-binding protein [Natronoglycomyces albus]QSB04081.1 TOMM precursor leader peptide-binding protein [Natronoglycomyces albus]